MRTFDFPSKSNPREFHTTTLHDDGRLTCSCRGFRTPSKCWHVKDVAEKQGLNIVVGGELIGNSITGYRVDTKPKQESLLGPVKLSPIKPMLASSLPEDMNIEDYVDGFVLEEKYDGHRLIVEVGDDIMAWSRAGNVRKLSSKVLASLKLMAPGIYDGELCIPGGTSTDVTALHLVDKSELMIFDMLSVGTASTRALPYLERRFLLEEADRHLDPDAKVKIASIYDVSRANLEKIWKNGGEGVILKRASASYEEGYRSKSWIKMKKEQFVICTIVSFVDGLLGPHSKINLIDEHGVEVQVKALNDEWRKIFSTRAAEFIGKKIRINYQNKTNTGRYRHPMADHILED